MIKFNISVCKKENLNDSVMFVGGTANSDSDEEIIKMASEIEQK